MRSTLFILLPAALAAQDFSKDVSPLLNANCVGCHNAATKMGGLLLDSYESMNKGGLHGSVVLPGRAAESRLYLRITGQEKPQMPLGMKPLSAAEIETIKKWIDGGAPAGASQGAPAAPRIIEVRPVVPVKPQIFALAYRPDGGMLALGGFKSVRLIDPKTRVTVGELPGEVEKVRALSFSRDNLLLAAAGGLPARRGEVKLWDVNSRTLLRTIEGHDDCIYAVAFSPDGKMLATSSYDKLIKLWEVATGKELRTLKDHIDAVYALAFTPDGKRLISGSADRSVKVWDPATGERLYTMSDAQDGINTVAVDPSGKFVAAGGADKTIRIWELGEKSGKLLHELIAHEDAILHIAWSPDGKTLVSTAADRSIKVFDAVDLRELKTLDGQPDWVMALEYSPDGSTLAAGRFDGSLELYR
jgi:hypothetical protein